MRYDVDEFIDLKSFVGRNKAESLQEYLENIPDIDISSEDGTLFESAIGNENYQTLFVLLDYSKKLIQTYPELEETIEEILVRYNDLYEPSSPKVIALIKPYIESNNEQDLSGFDDIFCSSDEVSESLQERSESYNSTLSGEAIDSTCVDAVI